MPRMPSPCQLHTAPSVTFENVCFHYNGSTDGSVLQGINLIVEPGQRVAILGATGSGKSTLINLIPRFYDTCEGRILIDGIDIRKIRQDSLLSQIGIVPQETVLFSGTVRDNIRYGRPDANDEAVIAGAKAAQAHEFILQLPEGYDTHVEERGTNLSGGQKQRIAIARALLTNPSILILDDSTSSVDVETETKIQSALDEVMKDRTSFVVAQRISTVLKADKIVVIDKGQIAAEGTHREFLQIKSDLPGNIRFPVGERGQRSIAMAEQPTTQPNASEIRSQMMRGGPGRPGKIEKARNPRRALVRLVAYLKPYALILSSFLRFILASTVLALVGPYLMGQAIDKFIAVKKISGLATDCLVDACRIYPWETCAMPPRAGSWRVFPRKRSRVCDTTCLGICRRFR